jgi:YVTN family beta-propeller protein
VAPAGGLNPAAWPTSPAGWPASPSWQQRPEGAGGDTPYVNDPPHGRRRLRVAGILVLALLLAAGAYAGIRYVSGRGTTEAGPAPTVTQTQPGVTQSALPTEPTAAIPVSLAVPIVVDTIKGVGREPEGVVVSPDSRTLYVADQGAKKVFFIDAASKEVTSVDVPNTPRFLALSRDGSRLYASMFENDFSVNALAVIDVAKRSVITSVATGPRPFEPAVAQDGKVWLPIHNGARVEIYDGVSLSRVSQISVPPNPHWIDFTPDGTRAFTSDHESSKVSVVDARTFKVLTSIPVGRSPHSVAVTPDGGTVVVTNYDVNTVETYDTKTLKLITRYKVGKLPQAVLVSSDGVRAYVVNEGSDTLSVLNLKDRKVAATVKVGDSPRVVALSPDGLRLFVTDGRDGAVTVLKAAQ